MNTLPIFAHFRQTAIAALAVLLGVFVFYTSFNGPFESLVQRAIFVMMITALAVLMHPLFEGSRLRPLGIAIDAVIVGVVTVSGAYIIANYETIMNDLPWANGWDMVMGFGTLACVLELARRSSNWVFPLIVIAAVTYAFFGYLIPGQFGHRGFDAGYLTEALEDVEEGEKALAEARANAEAKRKGGTRPTHALTEYAGRYDHVGYGVIEVTADDARLRLEYNSMPTDLEHWHYNTFNGADGGEDFEDLKVLFRLDADGEIVELAVPFEAQMDPIVFTKLADERLSDPDYLAQFVGIYELSGQRAEVMLQGTALRVALPGQPVYTLEPKRGTEFGIGNLSGFSLEFLLDNSGAVTAARFIQPNGVFEGKRVEE